MPCHPSLRQIFYYFFVKLERNIYYSKFNSRSLKYFLIWFSYKLASYIVIKMYLVDSTLLSHQKQLNYLIRISYLGFYKVYLHSTYLVHQFFSSMLEAQLHLLFANTTAAFEAMFKPNLLCSSSPRRGWGTSVQKSIGINKTATWLIWLCHSKAASYFHVLIPTRRLLRTNTLDTHQKNK